MEDSNANRHDDGEAMEQRFCRKCGNRMVAFDSLQDVGFTVTWFRCLTAGCHGVAVDVKSCFNLGEQVGGFTCDASYYSPYLFPWCLN